MGYFLFLRGLSIFLPHKNLHNPPSWQRGFDKIRLSGAMDGGSPAAARGPGRPETGFYRTLFAKKERAPPAEIIFMRKENRKTSKKKKWGL
jgi:hypothetical protein